MTVTIHSPHIVNSDSYNDLFISNVQFNYLIIEHMRLI